MYFPRLDTIRCYAVFAVVFAHIFSIWTWRSPDEVAAPLGYAGVVVFFVLSGFLITRLLMRESPDKTLTQSFLHFYARRCLRIFPIYYLYLAVVFYFNLADIAQVSFYPWLYLSNFYIYEHGWIDAHSHIWSLSVEEQFYLVAPLLVLFWRNNTRALFILFSAIILTALIARLYLTTQTGHITEVFTLACVDYLAIGGVLAVAYEKIGERIQPFGMPLVIWGIIIYFTTYFLKTQFAWGDLLFWSLGRMSLALFGAGLVIMALYGKEKFSLLHNSFTIRMGVISYGIYLYHNILIKYYADIARFFAIELGNSLTLKVITSLIITIALAEVSYRIIELPLLKLKNYFR